jgi:hypothetical protein
VDDVLRDLTDAGGLGLAVVRLGEGGAGGEIPDGLGVVRLGVHRGGPPPGEDLGAFDILLTADESAPAPWVGVPEAALQQTIEQLQAVVDGQPVAAGVAAQILRMTLKVSFEDSLVLESLGYSMLLGSEGFRTWRAAHPARRRRPQDDEPRVELTRDAGGLRISLTRAGARNAVDARMRDELVEALEFAVLDPDAAPVALGGQGPSFSAGGDLDEFGQADDPGRAHGIRVLRSATRLVRQMGSRVTARLHGACVGAGIEMPAAAGRVVARPGAFFRLPEVSMGLIPGAGGTASIPRRIGRQRACYMAISGCDVDLETALKWGLVDAEDGGQ